LFLPQAPPDKVSGLFHAATLLAQLLGQGRALDSRALRSAMETAFCGTDAEGAWVWKDAYEALEAAQVMFLRKFGAAMRTRAGSPAAMLEMLTRLAARLASQTRRSEESEPLQQFSTPIALGFVASEAAALTSADVVLEPSAGTGLLAIFAELAKAPLVLNEIADTRAGLLGRLFRDVAVMVLSTWREKPAIAADPVSAKRRFPAGAKVSGTPRLRTADGNATGDRRRARVLTQDQDIARQRDALTGAACSARAARREPAWLIWTFPGRSTEPDNRCTFVSSPQRGRGPFLPGPRGSGIGRRLRPARGPPHRWQ
jgi:hypothetical protein